MCVVVHANRSERASYRRMWWMLLPTQCQNLTSYVDEARQYPIIKCRNPSAAHKQSSELLTMTSSTSTFTFPHCHCGSSQAPGSTVPVAAWAGDSLRRIARAFSRCTEMLMLRVNPAASLPTSSPSRAAMALAMKAITRRAPTAKPPPCASTTKGMKWKPWSLHCLSVSRKRRL